MVVAAAAAAVEVEPPETTAVAVVVPVTTEVEVEETVAVVPVSYLKLLVAEVTREVAYWTMVLVATTTDAVVRDGRRVAVEREVTETTAEVATTTCSR